MAGVLMRVPFHLLSLPEDEIPPLVPQDISGRFLEVVSGRLSLVQVKPDFDPT